MIAFLINLIDRFSFSGKADLQIIMPVNGNTFSFKIPEIIMTHCHWKAFGSMRAKFSVGIVYQNFSH